MVTIKEISLYFKVFKYLLDASDFYVDIAAFKFEYKNKETISLDINFIYKIYPNPEEFDLSDVLSIITLEDISNELTVFLTDFKSSTGFTSNVNERIKKAFIDLMGNFISLNECNFYTTYIYRDNSQWQSCWVIHDKKNKRGLILALGAYD